MVPTLNPQEIFVSGIVTSALIVLFRWIYALAARKKFTVPDWVMIVTVYVVAFVLAMIFTPASLPAFSSSDPTAFAAWVGALLTYLTAVAMVATAFYFLILQSIKNAIIVVPPAPAKPAG